MILRRKAVRFDFGSRRIQSTEMADHQHSEESLVDKVSEKLHKRSSSSSSSSDDEKPPVSHQPSKSVNRTVGRKKSVHNCLGGRKAADLFLWRDKKRSASILAGATLLWILFECMEYHFLTFVCHVLILSLAILFIWINSAAFLKRYVFFSRRFRLGVYFIVWQGVINAHRMFRTNHPLKAGFFFFSMGVCSGLISHSKLVFSFFFSTGVCSGLITHSKLAFSFFRWEFAQD